MKLKITILFVITLLLSIQASRAAVFYPGEELKYKVTYLGITLGYITIISEVNEVGAFNSPLKARGLMESSKGIPFISLKAVFDSWIDASLQFSHKFEGKTRFGDNYDFQKIIFDYPNHIYQNQKWKNKKTDFDITGQLNCKYNDGLSLLFNARQNVHSQGLYTLPTIIESSDSAKTRLYCNNRKEWVGIDAVKYKIKTIYLNGQADWTGVYGISGKFEGWFSDDEASVPIKARMKVYIGNINIELISWKRGNWAPPK